MRVLSVDHVQIAIPLGAEQRARDFYCDVLGLVEIPKPASLSERGGLWLSVGGHQLHIGVDQAFAPAAKAHVAYLVDDLEAFRKTLIDNATVIVDSVPIPGFDRFEFRDPFGNRVELLGSAQQ
ncbi:MAG: VOC family protein [Actinomycetota bacterium]